MSFLKEKLGLFLFLLVLSGFSVYAYAQNIVKFSSSEDIAIAFYKSGNKIPNFERWIKETKPYNLTPVARRKERMAQEKSRLHLAYRNFDPDQDFLTIRTYVKMWPQEQINEAGEKTYSLHMTFIEAPEALYFPYEWLGERIVVMPHKLDKLMNSPITAAQYNLIKRSLASSAKNTLIVQLRVTEADLSQPYMIDGLQQWVLKAEVVVLEAWNRQGGRLWEYTAPWYVSPRTKKLNSLYDSRPAGSSERGAVKPLY